MTKKKYRRYSPDFIIRDGVAVTDATQRSSQDRSIHGFKKMLKEKPDKALALTERIIKNTYRTLMTRGQKGCYLFCTDEETNAYFKKFVDQAISGAESIDERKAADVD